MKFTKEFAGVPEGEVYPVNYGVGDECPPELEEAALEQGAVDAPADAAHAPADPAQAPADAAHAPADPAQAPADAAADKPAAPAKK